MKNRRMEIYIIGSLLVVLSTIIGATMYYRFSAGNFTFHVDPAAISLPNIRVADNIEFESASSSLNADSIVDKVRITYASIKLDEILQSEGQYIDPDQSYLAYSFYIKNTGLETVSIIHYMRLIEVSNSMDEYVRILIINDDGTYQMYQKADQPDENDNMPIYTQLPLGVNFETTRSIFSNSFQNFKPGDIKSFRVIIWLEEQDPDMSDNHLSGNIEAELIFSISHEHQTGSNQSVLLSSENEKLWTTLTQICSVKLGIYYAEDGN